jgi:hypothetical protein
VQGEIQTRLGEADRLRQQQVQRAQYEADRAQVRYLRVDPNNRLVADTLETQWNEKLRLLTEAKEDYEKQKQRDGVQITEEQKAKILALVSDFSKLWLDPKTRDRDRKRMARLLLEDVTLQRDREILVQVRFRGGATRELRLPLPKSAWALRKTKPEIVAEIDRLLENHSVREIAALLNQRGWHSSSGNEFTFRNVINLQRSHRLRGRRQRLCAQGWLSVREVASLLGCGWNCINHWRTLGLLESIKFSDKDDRLYRRPSESVIAEIKSRQRSKTPNTASTQSSAV